MDSWLMIAVIALLVLFSAFFSSTETAFSSVSKIRLKNKAENGDKKAAKALYIVEHYDNALSAILVGNNIVNIASSALATLLFVSFLGDATGTIVSTVVLTVVVLICGEVIPKNFAIENNEKLCLAFAGVLRFFMIIFTPITFLLLKLTDAVKKLSSRNKEKSPTVTEDELKYIVESIEEEGVLEEQESELVQSALEFDEKTAYDILTPRVDMVALEVNDDIEEVRELIFRERYSRIPVYENNIDNIIGVLYSRDFLEALLTDKKPEIKSLIQPAFFIYRSKKLSALLADFKYKKLHLAVVTDDYGGTLGIVTMEDLLEQIVGDIWDEDEEIEHKFKKTGENSYDISGDMNIDDMLELFELDEKYLHSDSKSVGGWVIEQIGDIPENGLTFKYKEMSVTVKSVEDQRINNIHVVFEKEKEDVKA